MFSRITIELSTNIPIPSTRPAIVIRLRVRPAKYINIMVTIIETGILMPIISVGLRERRKRNSTSTARIAPLTAVDTTWFSEFSISSVVLNVSLILMSWGSSRSMRLMRARRFLAVCTEFLPLCFCTIIITAGSLFT